MVVPVLRVLALRKYLLHDVPSLVITVFIAKYCLVLIILLFGKGLLYPEKKYNYRYSYNKKCYINYNKHLCFLFYKPQYGIK